MATTLVAAAACGSSTPGSPTGPTGPATTPPPVQAAVAADDNYTMTQGTTLRVAAPGIKANDTIPSGTTASVDFLPPLPPLENSGLENLDNGSGGFVLDLTRSTFSGVLRLPYRLLSGAQASNTANVIVQVGASPANGTFSGGGQGTSSQSTTATVEIRLTREGSLVTEVTIPWRVNTPPNTPESTHCSGTTTFRNVLIADDAFSASGGDRFPTTVRGRFTSPTAASGTFEVTRGANEPAWCLSATIGWTASRQ